MSETRYLNYRGTIKAILGGTDSLTFVTAHTEGQPTALYRLDAAKWALAAEALPCSATALVTDKEELFLAGTDHKLYRAPLQRGQAQPFGAAFADTPSALAVLVKARLAVLSGPSLFIVSRQDGKVLQTLELPEPGTTLAADPSGQWLVVGTDKGTILVYEGETREDFILSESQRLHEGAVTALLFEQDDLRFYSSGADRKLLSTHARGKLDPEDKGRGSSHADLATAMLWLSPDRFLTGSLDKTVKNWPRAGNVKPATLKDDIVKVTGLALAQLGKRKQVAVVCDDNTIRLFTVDEEERLGELVVRLHDAYDATRNELTQVEPARREVALHTLARFNDTAAVEVLAQQVTRDSDHGLRLLATQLLGAATLPRAGKLLEPLLQHNDEAVRRAALTGLRRHLGDAELRPLDLALAAEKADIGVVAIQGLQALAARDEQALERLVKALDAKTKEIRQAAVSALEQVYPADSAEANLLALGSKHADVRRLTLVRLLQRRLLDSARVQTALRLRTEDADAAVRKTAFLLALHTRPKLLQTLRERDPELRRQLVDLETKGEKKEAAADETPPPEPKKAAPAQLDAGDYEPILQATASRSLDTCLRGARGLAVLGDARAFGLLLQLSREEDAAARVDVCRALAALDDPRSIHRLRSLLYDDAESVRDAAFSALVRIQQAEPLQAAEAGLSATFEHVRRRALQVVLAELRRQLPTAATDPAWQLLVRALNDSFAGVRSEAGKAALNLRIGGGDDRTLRFILQSVHPDVRLDVLTEVMAQIEQPWAWPLLLEFFSDQDATLRSEAFEYAVKKNKELAPLSHALLAPYVDVRRLAVDALAKKHSKPAQAVLVRALADQERELRLAALAALVDDDAIPALESALQSAHDDVRVRAAVALARHGVHSALAPLRAFAAAPEPVQRERVSDWRELVEMALVGLAELGDPASLPDLLPLLQSKHDSLRLAAVKALVWVTRPDSLAAVRHALQHSDLNVKIHAAFGLALAGDPLAASLVFSADAQRILTPTERLTAALTLGKAGEDQLIQLLDDTNDALRQQALLLLLLLETRSLDGTPARCLACLSSRLPRVRLTAAQALELFASATTLFNYVVQMVNDRGDEQAWKIPPEQVATLADLLAYAPAPLRARTAALLQHFAVKEQAAWNQAWANHTRRFATEIQAVKQQHRSTPPVRVAQEQLAELAFGAYIGLVREQGSAHERQQRASLGAHIIRIRQTALTRLLALAQASPVFAAAVQPVLKQALGDPNQAVRLQAFDLLHTLGLDATALGAEALEAGHTDLGVRGLQLLSAGAKDARGQEVLAQVMLTRNDDLALEAAKMLLPARGKTAVAQQALDAAHGNVRKQAVDWLAEEYAADPAAQQALRAALQSRYPQIRGQAAFALATKKDTAAYDALVTQLQRQEDAGKQRSLIEALVTLGTPQTPVALIERVEHDPTGTALVEELLRAAGSFRNPTHVERLLTLAGKNDKWRKPTLSAVETISGHDQRIEDLEDEKPDKRWLQQQHPRHDAVLARLLERAYALGETKLVLKLLPAARWARGAEVEPVLAQLTNHADEQVRRGAVDALGWRLRKRNGSAEPLKRLLQHRDAQTQFSAAEGLAKGGRGEGLSVLLASIDFQTDLNLRWRAVQALGELGDARAQDVLLKLVNEDGHALQEAAAEALGRVGRTSRTEEIARLLERLARGNGGLALHALIGLRWLNTHAGWQLIRERARDPSFHDREPVILLLGENDDPATRDVLLELLRTVFSHLLADTITAASKLWGEENPEPDYALVQNPRSIDSPEILGISLDRLRQRGASDRIMAILPQVPFATRQVLGTYLLQRTPPPLQEARVALSSRHEGSCQIAAQILGRFGEATPEFEQAFTVAITHWRKEWSQRRRQQPPDEDRLMQTDVCLRSLLWAAGRLHIAAPELIATAAAEADDPRFRDIRLMAALALTEGPITEATAAALQQAALGNDPEIRVLAADALARHDAARAVELAKALLSDRVSFTRIRQLQPAAVAETVKQAAGQLHYQGVALPELVAQADLPTLRTVAENRSLAEPVRLGAIEGMALLGQPDAEARLQLFGQDNGEREEIRKAAWRGLRRSRRRRAAASKT